LIFFGDLKKNNFRDWKRVFSVIKTCIALYLGISHLNQIKKTSGVGEFA